MKIIFINFVLALCLLLPNVVMANEADDCQYNIVDVKMIEGVACKNGITAHELE